MTFYGHHGLKPEERTLGQRFVVDVELERELTTAERSDRLADTVDYGEVFRLVKGVMEGPPRNLLERLAGEIAQRILSAFLVDSVRVRVHKPHAPLQDALLAEAWVEVERRRGSAASP